MSLFQQPRRTTGPIAGFQLVSIREGTNSCLGGTVSGGIGAPKACQKKIFRGPTNRGPRGTGDAARASVAFQEKRS
jgi:hypothetical protein